MIWVEHLELDL